MPTRIQDFFIPTNRESGITPEHYRMAAVVVDAAKAFARSAFQSVYIIDYFQHDFLWASDSLAVLCGETPEAIQRGGYNIYIKHVPADEQQMLLEINEKGFQLFDSLPVDERKDYTITYDFHLANGSRRRLINHKLTPLVLMPDGRIWLALCTVAPSAHRSPGHIVLRKSGGRTRYEYDLAAHRWEERPEPHLTDIERSVLLLSSQGLSMQEIADRLHRSLSAIKSCKTLLFDRLGVSNITEATMYAANYRLL